MFCSKITRQSATGICPCGLIIYIYLRVHCLSSRCCPIIVVIRETREGWPLRTVETEANGGLMEYKWRLSFLGWFARIVVPVWEIFILPWLLWSAQYKIFFSSPYTFSLLYVLIAQQPGQAVVRGRLSLNMCLRSCLINWPLLPL
jgi:hypothetical protein